MISQGEITSVTVSVADVRVDNFCHSEVLNIIKQSLERTQSFYAIHTLNPEILMQAYRSPEYVKILNGGNINVVDGVGLQIAVRYKTGKFFERICGSDLIFDLAAMAENARRPLLLLGGLPTRLEKAKTALRQRYPNLELVGLAPTFSSTLPLHEQQQLEDLLRITRPGVVAVFLGAPRQETWIAQNRELLQSCDVSVAAGLGGTVDFLSGDVIRAPRWIQAIGFEWAFRLLQEPQRFKRQLSNLPEFALRALLSRNFVSFARIPGEAEV